MCNDTGFGETVVLRRKVKGHRGMKYSLNFRQVIEINEEQAALADRYLAEGNYDDMEEWIRSSFPHDYERVRQFFNQHREAEKD